jgi:PEP-CTERM motif-containing protein
VRINSLKLLVLVLVVVAALAMVPMAAANSIVTSCCGLPANTEVATFTLTQVGSNVQVTITMDSGFTLLTEGGDIGIDTTGGLTLSGSSLSGFSVSGMTDMLKSNTTLGGFTFSDVFLTHHTGGQLFVTSLTFTIANATVSQITGIGIHFCVGNPCTGNTGFAGPGPAPTIPEPGTLGLLGTGLVGIAGLVRRRFLS